MNILKVEEILLSQLIPADYNPRKISKDELNKLDDSVENFGLVDPIIINLQNPKIINDLPYYIVIGGHQRLDVLIRKGKKQVYLLRLGDIGWVFTEKEIKLKDENTIKALNIALNKINGEWDEKKLEAVLSELKVTGFNVDLTGFSQDEVLELQTEFQSLDEVKEDDEFDIDEAIENIETPKTQPGEIYKLGNHRLMCGDSTKKFEVEQLLEGKIPDMVFTDPPYNVNYGSSKNPRHKIRSIENDAQDTDEWIDFNKKLVEILKLSSGDIYIWGASGPDGMLQRLLFCEAGAHWSATIIWKKDQLVLSPAKYQRIYEPCFYGWFEKSSFRADRKQVEVWEFPRPKKSELHPTMKPIELCANALKNSSKIEDIVLDLFGGSGSTLMAAEQTQRKCYMMELDPKYCDVIIKRWETYTGEEAILLTTEV